MARQAERSIHIEWFNVTYRGVMNTIVALVLLAGGGLAAWYYFGFYAPKQAAGTAIARAVTQFDHASALGADEQIAEIIQNAEVSLRDARVLFGEGRYDDSRVAAMRSEQWSLQALRINGESDTKQQLVHFTDLEGDVRVKRSGEFSWEQANPRMTLGLGDQVKTSSSGSAELMYFDGTVTTVRPGSLLEIRELYEDPVTKVRRVKEKLNFGEVKATTQDRNVSGSFHEVATENVSARAEHRGEFRVSFDQQARTARFDVFDGGIEVSSPGRKESLAAGEGISSNSAGQFSAKQLLPAAPRLIAPRDQRVFITEQERLDTLALTWERVGGAENYHLLISNRPLFTEPLFEGKRASTSATLGDIPPSSYYWKVAAVSSDGVEGPFSNPAQFRVSSQKIRDRSDVEPPALEITEFVPVGMMVIVNGRTEPGASLWVNDEKIDVYDDGTFYAVVRLRKEGINDLRFLAQDNAGNETELTRSADVELE